MVAGPFPRGLPPNRADPFPSTRLSCGYGVDAGVAWMCRWQASQTTRVLRRLFAMILAYPGGLPAALARSASFRTWCTSMVSVLAQISHLPLSSRLMSCLWG